MELDNRRRTTLRNITSFWLFGLCNNFGYVMMLSAAQDILSKSEHNGNEKMSDGNEDVCLNSTEIRYCTEVSTGVVLLCNILPSLFIKLLAPFFLHKLQYGFRQAIICSSIIISFIVTAFSENVYIALIGVMVTSFSSGLGECTFLALSSHFPSSSISAWSSGTGAAGVFGAFAYAIMTDSKFLNLSSTTTILISLIVPILFLIMYYFVLVLPPTVQQADVFQPKTWFKNENDVEKTESDEEKTNVSLTNGQKMRIVYSLLIYMIPIALVYFAEYFVNQGLVELTVFDCAHGFSTSPKSQYRWYQVLYQVGVFISRSSSDIIQLSMAFILLLPILQFAIVFFFLANSLHPFIPHFAIACCIVIFEGLIGGSSYVHSFRHLHNHVDESAREFALGIVSGADGFGIILAAFTSIPVHNYICKTGYV